MQSIWTHDDREAWIAEAISSDEERGHKNGHNFFHMKIEPGAYVDEDNRGFMTGCLADAIFNNSPVFKKLSLNFYGDLLQKVHENNFLAFNYNRGNFVIIVKGSNAYKLLLRGVEGNFPDVGKIEHSDLDIAVFINPYLHADLFARIRESMIICVSQVMSRYKKELDNMLFSAGYDGNGMWSVEDVAAFKAAYNEAVEDKGCDGEGYFVSPFQDDLTRNECSRRSFLIRKNQEKGTTIRVEVPHLNKCERIPLKKTPFVVSHNNTISFIRDKDGFYNGEFDLIRLRLNNLLMTEAKSKVVPADFIDVSIPSHNDAQLYDFWQRRSISRCVEIYDEDTSVCVIVPDLDECIHDLHMMLHVYDNNQIKVEKRKERIELFLAVKESL